MKKNKKKHKSKKADKHEIALLEPAVTGDEPVELGRDEAAAALVAAMEHAARLGVRVAVDGEGYTILHGREEERCGEANLAGIVVRRTPARRERAAAAGTAKPRGAGAVAR